jgi:predicted extracellular nuclease
MFNPKSIETVKGVVTEITDFQLASGEQGVLLKLESDNGIHMVHLGPVWFMNNQGIQLKAGDKVTVKGSQVEYQNGSALIAQAVVRQNQMLVLRSSSGAPAWSAWTTL